MKAFANEARRHARKQQTMKEFANATRRHARRQQTMKEFANEIRKDTKKAVDASANHFEVKAEVKISMRRGMIVLVIQKMKIVRS